MKVAKRLDLKCSRDEKKEVVTMWWDGGSSVLLWQSVCNLWMCQSNTLYLFNLHNVVWQLYLNKPGGEVVMMRL